jgi:hypothetical protein
MEISHEKTTSIGYGFSTLADAFQAGRDAGQMAKSQLPDAPLDLAVAVGPADIHFKDFIEGVRLVTGEKTLLGLPGPWVIATDAPGTRARAVLLMQSEAQKVTVVSASEEKSPLVAITSLMTHLRAQRGNARSDYDFHGLLAVDNNVQTPPRFVSHHLAADAGLEAWLAGFSLWPGAGAPLICGAQAWPHGIAAVECLSSTPWGLGWVDTTAFASETSVQKEAAHASMREALTQLQSRKPAMGFLLVGTRHRPILDMHAQELFRSAAAAVPNVPLVSLPIHAPYLRGAGRAVPGAYEGILSVLVPR